MATTTHPHDYLGRELDNDDPGTTDPARDFLGREIGDSDDDYIGRDLQTIED